jgi:hypothetical protein
MLIFDAVIGRVKKEKRERESIFAKRNESTESLDFSSLCWNLNEWLFSTHATSYSNLQEKVSSFVYCVSINCVTRGGGGVEWSDSERDAVSLVKTTQIGRAAKNWDFWRVFALNVDQQSLKKGIEIPKFRCGTCRKVRVTFRAASCDSGEVVSGGGVRKSCESA